MVQHFTTVIPSRCEEAVSRWSTFVTHPDVPDLIVSLRDDRISNEERTNVTSGGGMKTKARVSTSMRSPPSSATVRKIIGSTMKRSSARFLERLRAVICAS